MEKTKEFLTFQIESDLKRKVKKLLIDKKSNLSEWLRKQIKDFVEREAK